MKSERQAGNRPGALFDQGHVCGFRSELMENHWRNQARV